MNLDLLYQAMTDQEKSELQQIVLKKFREENVIKNLTIIPLWIDKHPEIDRRMRDTLISIYEDTGMFVEEISESYFLRYRNAGIKSWKEFQILRAHERFEYL